MTDKDFEVLINYLNTTHPEQIRLVHDEVEMIVTSLEYFKEHVLP